MAAQAARIRPPAVAGHFYPRDPAQLRSEVQDLLGRSSSGPTITPKALIAPHAGYVYSGKIAAAAFATLRHCAQTTTRVVLIGPAHYVRVRGIAAPTVQAFATPLGRVPVDAEGLRGIVDLPFVAYADEPHAPEHALEVELPFLQASLAVLEVLPLVVGDASPSDVAQVLRRLWGGPETLIVVSSDLSHYHSYETARRLDLATATAIERGDWGGVGPDQACGCLAVAGLLVEARRRVAPRPQGSAACLVQFRRYSRGARSGRWVRCLGIYLDVGGQTRFTTARSVGGWRALPLATRKATSPAAAPAGRGPIRLK